MLNVKLRHYRCKTTRISKSVRYPAHFVIMTNNSEALHFAQSTVPVYLVSESNTHTVFSDLISSTTRVVQLRYPIISLEGGIFTRPQIQIDSVRYLNDMYGTVADYRRFNSR